VDEVLMEDLLAQTLEWARREVPFYARSLKGVRTHQRAPFLTKDEAVKHQEALVARGAPKAFAGVVSSGTTARDRPLRVPRTEEEVELGEAAAVRPGGRLVLEVRAVHHGLSHLAPRPDWLRVPWTYSANSFRLVESLLLEPQPDGRRVTDLLINAGALMPLCVWLKERGVDARKFGVRTVSTTSFRLSPHWRAHVERTFRARVFDNYSLSEIPTPALECPECGFNHWLQPPVFAEVVEVGTKRPVKRGLGALALTTLYPWVQAMPLIRYWTGDVVELGPRCAVAQAQGIRFRGRIGQSLVKGSAVLIAAQDAIDFLEGEPLVARHLHPVETMGLIPEGQCGAVKLELELVKDNPCARVELTFDPKAFPAEAEALGERFAAHLSKSSPPLRALEKRDRGELTIDLCAPGTLKRAWTKW
jgi:hypothetical protein